MRARSTDSGAAPEQIGLELRVETPENVVLVYWLAGPATRALAYLVDFFARATVLVLAAFVGTLASMALPGLSFGLLLILWFVLEWLYFVICETWFHGKSLGKAAMGLRVIQEQGHPVTFWPSLLRNLTRAIDATPLYGPAIISMICSRHMQRLGDLAARTVVVHERQVKLPREPLIVETIEPLSRDEIGHYVPTVETLALIDRFLGRRGVLTHKRGHALASLLAGVLARRLNYGGDAGFVERYPMAFLARVYVTFAKRRDDDEAEEWTESGAATSSLPAEIPA